MNTNSNADNLKVANQKNMSDEKSAQKIKLYHGDCLKAMKDIPDNCIDMVLCDLPYGTTQNKWDEIIPFKELWSQYERIIKDNGAILLFAQTPFDKILGASNLKLLKYEWIWEKTTATGHLNANKMPMKAHENILVFYKKLPKYNPQKTTGHNPMHRATNKNNGSNYGKSKIAITEGGRTDRYPRSVQIFKTDKQKSCLHPTQKPVDLLKYFIKTYTDENDTVLDNCMGSGSTGIACMNLNRNFIGIELDKNYFDIAEKRLSSLLSVK